MCGGEALRAAHADDSDERTAAEEIVRTLSAAGFTAYFAGGCVRDALLGRLPKDYDVATDARPPDIRAIFPDAQPVGEAFGVMLVHRRGHAIQVASFRSDGPYSDQRRPDHISFADEREDAARRDFTINGLFLDPATGGVIDHVGGRADLEAGVIRAIGDPEQRLREDHLRMLRAVRFAARYGFEIDPLTAQAITRHAAQLRGISPERVGQECRLMLVHPARARAVEWIRELGLDVPIVGRSAAAGFGTRLAALESARQEDAAESSSAREVTVPLALAAWFLDRGESAEGEALRTWNRALVLSREESGGMEVITRLTATIPAEWPRLSTAARRRMAGDRWFSDVRHMLRAGDAAERALERVICADLAPFGDEGILPPPLVRGDDLLTLGIRPGPQLGAALDRLYDEQLDGFLTDRTQAMRRARTLVHESRGEL